MEPSKLLGYRDSHILFQKHPQLKRVRITDEERQHLINTGLLITRFKNPEVAVVTARSLYKCFGHKVIKNGKRIQDDYYESEPGRHIVHHTAEETKEEEEIEDNSRKSLIGKTSRSEGYSSAVPLSNETWMHHAALAARGFNAQLHERRAGKPTFYDIHSNINQVPASYQPSVCHFKFSRDKNEKQVEFIKKSNIHNTPLYRGLGKDLLEYDIETAIQTLSTDKEKEQARHVLAVEENHIKDEEEYPLSLMEGQFQSAFPIHQARFNYPIPKIPEPTILVDTAQSLAAQQYYLSLVYQSVNQYADPHRQQSPIARASPTNYIQPQQTPLLQQHIMQQPQRVPIVPQLAESPVCGTLLAGNQICKRPVNRQGEKCQLHLPVKPMSEYAKAEPPVSDSPDVQNHVC